MAFQLSDTRTINQLWVHANSYIRPVIEDMWTNGTNLLAFLNNEKYAKNKVKELVDGGVDLREGIETEAGTAYNFWGFSTYPLEAHDPWSQGKWAWRGIVVPTGVALSEILQTNGEKNAVGKLVANKNKHAMRTFRQVLTRQLLDGNTGISGTLGSGSAVDGLKFALQYQNNTNDGYAGWNRSTHPWARHEVQDVGTAFTVSSGVIQSDNLCTYLDKYILTCQRGFGEEGNINLILTTTEGLRYLVQRARWSGQVQIVVNANLVDIGLRCIEYDGIPVIHEPEMSSYLPGPEGETGQGYYGFNTRFMKLYVHKEADMKMSALEKVPGQQAFTADMIWVGNLAILNPRFFFTLYGTDAPTIT